MGGAVCVGIRESCSTGRISDVPQCKRVSVYAWTIEVHAFI